MHECQNTDRHFHRSATGAQIAKVTLRRGYGHVAEALADRLRFDGVTIGCPRRVGVDMSDLFRGPACDRQGRVYRSANRLAT